MTDNFKNRKYRKPLAQVLIICEGEGFEYDYFCNFKTLELENTPMIVKNSQGRTNILQIVKRAIKFIEEEQKKSLAVNALVFCISDISGNTQQQIYDALKKANDNNIKLLVSNPCIEFWFLSHFEEITQSLICKQAEKRLELIFPTYDKGSNFTEKENLISQLIENTAKACDFIQYKLEKEHCAVGRTIDAYNENKNPFSNIYLLIKELTYFQD